MNYQYDFLEWEITTACNAACPQCPRNYYGGSTWHTLPIVQNSLIWAKQYLPVDFIQRLRRIDFCGTYGDPIVNNELIDIVLWLLKVNPDLNITIKTNGSIRDSVWWAKLATTLGSNGSVFFGIDGLENTNHLYRKNTNFNKIIENATAFIKAGGIAHWSYIVFKHNEHQVDAAKQLSTDLGFANFNVKLTGRFFNKNHEIVKNVLVYNSKNQPEYTIELPTRTKYVNMAYSEIDQVNSNTEIKCKCKTLNRIYLSAEGYVFPCGWLHDRMYGHEAEQHPDHQKLENLFDLAGGKHLANIVHTNIDNIINGAWFKTIQDSWSNHDTKLDRCQIMCGNTADLIGNQNKLLQVF
jgi:MoaA/NifB/PqqE/SkfB family radical SAM enzyme